VSKPKIPVTIQDLFDLYEHRGRSTSSLVDMSSIDFPYLKRTINKIDKALGTLVQNRAHDAFEGFVHVEEYASDLNNKVMEMLSRYEVVIDTLEDEYPRLSGQIPFTENLTDVGRGASAIQEQADDAMDILQTEFIDNEDDYDTDDYDYESEVMGVVEGFLAEMESELDVMRRNYNQLTKKRRR
jgi:hypothetical protein